MKKTLLYAFCLLFFALSQAQSQTEVNLKSLDKYYAKMVKDWDVPGVSIGIVKDGKLVFTGNYGTNEIGKKQKPNEQTLYAIASNSKAFTSALIGRFRKVNSTGMTGCSPTSPILPSMTTGSAIT